MSLHPIQSRLKLFLVEKNEWICSELRGSLTQYPPFFQWFEEHEKKTRPLFSPAQEQDDTQRCRTLIYASSFLSISSYLRKAGGWRHLYFIKQTCICHRQKENTQCCGAAKKLLDAPNRLFFLLFPVTSKQPARKHGQRSNNAVIKNPLCIRQSST